MDPTLLSYLKSRKVPKTAEEAAALPCPAMFCPTAEECGIYAQPCNTSEDCFPTSCCSVIMLENVTGNISGSAIPEGRADRCQQADVYCEGRYKVCVVSEPSWRGFSDQDAVKVFQGAIPNPINEAQAMAIMARAEAFRQQKLREQENGNHSQAEGARFRVF